MSPFEEDDSDDYWPDEPKEFDPDSIGPKVDIPEAPSFDGDADDDVVQSFWAAVLLANFGLFAASLGLMLVVFQGRYELGGFVFALGALGLLFTYRRYRAFQGQSGDEEGQSESDGPDVADTPDATDDND
ncbi:DUF7322 domain-containing protein [Halomarina litorea]|uniref:DUF7322 domain-containing protein n=1 Tax=Halomarina litorea TaxID=2961595 RepID=UPI0020C1E00E|nr:hypothetical protein [Halomarina sp. BCD28]